MFQLIRTLGISIAVTRDAYLDALLMSPRKLDTHGRVAFARPKQHEQKMLLVEAFMKGAT